MRIIVLESGRTRATVAPDAGGRLLQLEVFEGDMWTPLLVAPHDVQLLLDEPLLWACYPMTPWPGRVAHSRFTWKGRAFDLPANDGAHSIHGRAAYLPWVVQEATSHSCQLAIELGPANGWPFAARVTQDIGVSNAGVSLRLVVASRESASFPAGAGWHPWFRRDVRPQAIPRVRVAADSHHESSLDLIPTGTVTPPSGVADLATGPSIDGLALDDFYGGVTEPLAVQWDDLQLTMRSSANMRHAVVSTRSPRGFCLEPQTCAPDAFNLASRGVPDTGLIIVEPDRPLVAETTWTWKSAPPARRQNRP